MIVNPQVFSRPQSTSFAQALDPFSQGLGFSAPRFGQVPAFNFDSFVAPTYGSVPNVYGGLGLLDARPAGINQFMQNYGLLSNAPAQNFGTQPNQPAPQPVPNFQPPPLPPVDTSVHQPGGGTDSSGPVANIGSGVTTAQPYNHVGASATNNSDMYGGGFGADNSMTMGTGLAPSQGDPVMLAYQDAVKSAQEQRKNGFMGRVVLPGEMGFDRFAEGYNYRLNNPNLQSLATVGNDGFGSVSQGPLDFTDGSNWAGLPGPTIPTFVDPPRGMEGQPGYGNIAQPALGGNVGGDFAESAQSYFNPGDGGQSAYGPIPLSPDRLVQVAQGRLATRDVKPPEVMAYLNNVIKTGGVPTMMAPQQSTNFSSLMSVGGLGGGLITGQPSSGFGLPDGNGPGGVTLRPTPGAMPI